jgi:hypothetical protein
MKRVLASMCGLAAMTLGALGACGKTENVSPSDVVVQFYVTIELSGIRDVPEPRALLALEPYLTDSLTSALRNAHALRADAAAKLPGEKPPFADGNPFSGLFEGHSTYVVRGATERGDSAFVTVAFTNTEQKPAVSWSDTVVLVKSEAAARQSSAGKAIPSPVWRIADLRYGGNWEFGYRGSLRQVLQQAPERDTASTPPSGAVPLR